MDKSGWWIGAMLFILFAGGGVTWWTGHNPPLFMGLMLVLLTVLVGMAYVLLRRTDAGIRAQQAELRESEENHRLLTEHAVSAVMEGTAWVCG